MLQGSLFERLENGPDQRSRSIPRPRKQEIFPSPVSGICQHQQFKGAARSPAGPVFPSYHMSESEFDACFPRLSAMFRVLHVRSFVIYLHFPLPKLCINFFQAISDLKHWNCSNLVCSVNVMLSEHGESSFFTNMKA